MMISPNYISYKDPTARVIQKDGLYYRLITYNYKTEYDHLMQSGLYDQLSQKGIIISHTEIPNDLVTDNNKAQHSLYKTLLPDQITFQSYPFEWSYSQWRKAIITFLQINLISLKFGMVLKDATPFNFYIKEGKAVLLDTSSFSFFKDGDKWNAYNQFCQMFLGPIVLMHYYGQKWSRIMRVNLRGLPLPFVSKVLPLKSWFNINVLLHLHLHGKYSNKNGGSAKQSQGFSIAKLESMIDILLSTIQKWDKPFQFENHWASYYDKEIESKNYLAHKEEVLNQWLNELTPKSVLDLGANTGKFSLIAEKYCKKVIAIESDDLCVDILDTLVEKEKKSIYPLVMDLVESTSNIGALNKEYESIYARANSELVAALALIHHLYFNNQLSFSLIGEMLSIFSSKYLIVEFIPKTDNKVALLMNGKIIDSNDYTIENFIDSMSTRFKINEQIALNDSERTLFLLEKLN